MFCTINYKTDPDIEAEVEEIVGIFKAKGVNVRELFEKFDKNKSGALDTYEFRDMILSIAPKYNWEQLRRLYAKLDKNKSGLVDKAELLAVIGGGMATQNNYVGIWMEKAQRNIKMLKIHLNHMKLSPSDVIKMADLDADGQIDEGEFLGLLGKISFKISKEEVGDIFKMVDSNHSGKISFGELVEYLK